MNRPARLALLAILLIAGCRDRRSERAADVGAAPSSPGDLAARDPNADSIDLPAASRAILSQSQYEATFATPSGLEDESGKPTNEEREKLSNISFNGRLTDTEQFVTWLRSRRPELRAAAADSLYEVSKLMEPDESSEITDQLERAVIALLTDTHGEARLWAPRILGCPAWVARTGKEIIPRLVQALRDPDDRTVSSAALAIGQHGEEGGEAAKDLAALLSRRRRWMLSESSYDREVPPVAAAAAEALGRLGEFGRPYVDQLKPLMSVPGAASQAGIALVRLGQQEWIIEQAEKQATDGMAIVASLNAIETPSEKVASLLVVQIKEDTASDWIKREAVDGLSRFEASEMIIEALGHVVRSEDEFLVSEAVAVLGQLEPKLPSAIPHLQHALARSNRGELRLSDLPEVVAALEGYQVDPASKFRNLLGATDNLGILRYDARWELEDLENVVALLLDVAGDGNASEQLKINAFYLLSWKIGSLSADELESLIAVARKVLEDGSTPAVMSFAAIAEMKALRRSAKQELSDSEKMRLAPFLLRGVVESEHDGARIAAMKVMGDFQCPPAAADAAIRLLNGHDNETTLRIEAARLAGKFTTQSDTLVPALLDALLQAEGEPGSFERVAAAILDSIQALVTHPEGDPQPALATFRKVLTENGSPANDDEYDIRDSTHELICESLAKYPLGIAAPLAESVATHLGAKYHENRIAAAQALQAMGPEASTSSPALLEALIHEEGRRAELTPRQGAQGATHVIQLCRNAYLNALGGVGGDSAKCVPVLRSYLMSEKHYQAAAYALSAHGVAARDAVPEISKWLADSSEPKIRRSLVKSLGRLGETATAAVPLLIKVAEEDPEEDVREAATYALLEIAPGDPTVQLTLSKTVFQIRPARNTTHALEQKRYFDACRSAAILGLQHEDEEVRRAVIPLFRFFSDETLRQYIDVFEAGLASDDVEVRNAAVERLTKLGGADEVLAPYFVKALADSDRRSAATARSRLSQMGRKALPSLAAALKSSETSPQVKAKTCQFLVSVRGHGLLGELQAATQSDDPLLKGWALVALLRETPDKDVAALVSNLASEDSELRRASLDYLIGERLDQPAAAVVLGALGDEAPMVRHAAARCVASMEFTEAVKQHLEKALRTPGSQAAAASAVSQMHPPRASFTDALAGALVSDDQETRRAAAGALVSIGEPAVAALVAVVNHQEHSEQTREAAIVALGEMSSIPEGNMRDLALQVMGESPRLRLQAAAAMARLGSAHEKVQQALLEGVNEKDWKVKGNLDQAFAALGEKASSSAPALIQLVEARDESSRQAAQWLAEVSPHSAEAARAIVGLLETKEASGVSYTISRFGELAVTPLKGVLENSSEATAQMAAARALGMIGREAAPAVDPLRKLLDASNEDLALSAAEALVQIAPQTPGTLELLRKTLSSFSNQARRAAFALGRLGPAAAPAVEELTQLLDKPRVAHAAIEALGRIGEAARPAAPALLARLESNDDASIFSAIAGALADMGAEEAAPALLAALDDPDKTRAAATALAQLGVADEAAIARLTEALDDPATQRAALQGLGVFGQRAGPAVPSMLGLLDDPSASLVRLTIGTLQSIGEAAAPAAPKLAPMLKSKDASMAAAAARALGLTKDRQGADVLIEALQSERILVARAAARGLQNFPDHEPATKALVKALDNGELRATAAYAVATHPTAADKAVPHLLELLESDYERYAAARALEAVFSSDSSEAAGEDVVPVWPTLRSQAARALLETYRKTRGAARQPLARAIWAVDPDAAAEAEIPSPEREQN